MSLLDPHPILNLGGGIHLYIHGLFFALGALAATLVLIRLLRGELTPVQVAERVFWIFFLSLFVARLGYLLSYPDLWTDPGQIFRIWEGGLVSYYGMAAGLVVSWFFVRQDSPAIGRRWLDGVALATLVGWAIGRWGNYYAAESYGVISSHWTAFYGRVPIQLFESVWCVALAFALWKFPPRRPLLLWAVVGYAAGRFVIDIWRDESVYAGLHVSQWVSVVMLAVGLYFLKREKK